MWYGTFRHSRQRDWFCLTAEKTHRHFGLQRGNGAQHTSVHNLYSKLLCKNKERFNFIMFTSVPPVNTSSHLCTSFFLMFKAIDLWASVEKVVAVIYERRLHFLVPFKKVWIIRKEGNAGQFSPLLAISSWQHFTHINSNPCVPMIIFFDIVVHVSKWPGCL
jgi:hypothetical protein